MNYCPALLVVTVTCSTRKLSFLFVATPITVFQALPFMCWSPGMPCVAFFQWEDTTQSKHCRDLYVVCSWHVLLTWCSVLSPEIFKLKHYTHVHMAKICSLALLRSRPNPNDWLMVLSVNTWSTAWQSITSYLCHLILQICLLFPLNTNVDSTLQQRTNNLKYRDIIQI